MQEVRTDFLKTFLLVLLLNIKNVEIIIYFLQHPYKSCTVTFYICGQVDQQLALAITQFVQTKRGFACALSMSAPMDGSESL